MSAPKSPPLEAQSELAILAPARFGSPSATIAAADGKGPQQRTVEIVAYTGGLLTSQGDYGWDYPVVCDVQGFDLSQETFPLLDNHGGDWFNREKLRDTVVGQANSARVSGSELKLSGGMFDTEAAREIIGLADQGFAWQTSIGAKVMARKFIPEGTSVEVNSRTFEGPVYVATKTKLREVSFVVLGDDSDTSAIIARLKKKGKAMNPTAIVADASDDEKFKAWCKGEGYGDPDTMTERMKTRMRAEYDESTDDDSDEEDEDTKPAAKNAKAGDDNDKEKDKPASAKASATLDLRAEAVRIHRIQALLATKPGLKVPVERNGKYVDEDLAATAIAEGWTEKKVKLEILRADRGTPGPTWYAPSQPQLNQAVIESAILRAAACPLEQDEYYFNRGPEGRPERRVPEFIQRDTQREFRARYTDQVQQAAHDMFVNASSPNYVGEMGLQHLLLMVARAGGYNGRANQINNGNLEEVLRASFDKTMIRAEGGSTISIQNLLANVLNKMLLTGYTHTDMSWREICSVRPVKDFKPSKSINVTGDFIYKKLNADGQIQNAALTDEAYANQIDTFARKLGISRQMIINDDISGLTTVPMLMGIGANDSISILFWTLFLNPGNWTDGNAFWYSARNVAASLLGGGAIQANALAAGASSALSSTSLQSAVTLFDMQVKANGQPLGVPPAILLYPPALDATAVELMNAQFLVYGGGTASKQPNTNVFKGRFKPVKSPYIQNPNYTGYSATQWWLLSNPQLTGLSTIEMAFLNGQETPTVQTAQANFNELGIDIRGFFDYGVAMQNPRASVKSPGA
jgi:hypothetical protein